MEIKNEVPFAGKMYNGFAMLFFNLFMYVAGILLIVAATAIDVDLTMAVIGGVLGWIFQDTIKGVFAFIYLRMNSLLHIGDWIELPKHDVEARLVV